MVAFTIRILARYLTHPHPRKQGPGPTQEGVLKGHLQDPIGPLFPGRAGAQEEKTSSSPISLSCFPCPCIFPHVCGPWLSIQL